jgi:hypothetical protein
MQKATVNKIKIDKSTHVAHVRFAVQGRAANVHTHTAIIQGDKRFFFPAQAVIDVQGFVGVHRLNNETKLGKRRISHLKGRQELMKEYAYFWA